MLAALLSAFLVSQAADTASTLRLLQRPGFYEANRLLPASPRGILTLKMAVSSAVVVTAWKARHRHPRLVRVMLLVGTASATAATVHNLRQRIR